MLKKRVVAMVALVTLTTPFVALAADYGLGVTASNLGYNQSDTVTSVVGNVVSTGLTLIGILFFGMMMYAGLRWMTARGNDELKEKAIHTLQAAILGMVVVAASYAITYFILNKLAPPAPSGQATAPTQQTKAEACSDYTSLSGQSDPSNCTNAKDGQSCQPVFPPSNPPDSYSTFVCVSTKNVSACQLSVDNCRTVCLKQDNPKQCEDSLCPVSQLAQNSNCQ